MWGMVPDLGPDPASECQPSDSSRGTSGTADERLAGRPVDGLTDETSQTADACKKGGESSDSGKESGDEDNKMDDGDDEDEEDYEGEDEDDYEDYQDCEGFDDRGDYPWSCYLTTIEEEEEEQPEEETEGSRQEENQDSGNDSDLEKSELETFEMLEKLCEFETIRVEKERGRVSSYHEYKRLKAASPVLSEYRNQIIIEKDVKGLKIKAKKGEDDENAAGKERDESKCSDSMSGLESEAYEVTTGESRDNLGESREELVESREKLVESREKLVESREKSGESRDWSGDSLGKSLDGSTERHLSSKQWQDACKRRDTLEEHLDKLEERRNALRERRKISELQDTSGRPQDTSEKRRATLDVNGDDPAEVRGTFENSISSFKFPYGFDKPSARLPDEKYGDLLMGKGRSDTGTFEELVENGSKNGYDTFLISDEYGDATVEFGDAAVEYGDATVEYGDATVEHGDASEEYGRTVQYGNEQLGAAAEYGDAAGKYGDPTVEYGDTTAEYGYPNVEYGDTTVEYEEAPDEYGDATVPDGYGDSAVEHGDPHVRYGDGDPADYGDASDTESILEVRVPHDFDETRIPSTWLVHKDDLRTSPSVPVASCGTAGPPGSIREDVLRPAAPPAHRINTRPTGRRPVAAGLAMKHDPDLKIKSALKRGASSKKRKKHKVQFDESLNKFFEADYVILIREECGGGGCDCGGGGDYCYGADDDDDDLLPTAPSAPAMAALDLAPFEPPSEFVDQLTLSPPDGYKDHHCLHHQPPVPAGEEVNGNFVTGPVERAGGGSACFALPPTEPDGSGSYECKYSGGMASDSTPSRDFARPMYDETRERWPPEEPKCEDGQTQTTPTSETEDNDGPLSLAEVPEKKERYIVETITMTTVTERRIIREAEAELEGAGVFPKAATADMTATTTTTTKDKEMTLTFKLGSNSLKPNSALRQLFPRIASPPPDKSPDSDDDSLQSNLIKRTIERNTLRRSLVRYPDIRKRNQAKKNENSLVERIKKLTCDIDDDDMSTTTSTRGSPTGEESKDLCGNMHDSSTALVESSKVPAYRKITDIFIRNREPHPVVLQAPTSVEHQYPYYHQPYNPPDLGNGLPKTRQSHDARKQFLSSLAPLAACVSSSIDDAPGSRESTSTVDTDYSLGDIDDVLKDQKPQPDIVVGTPGNESDELALFVQQDASRIERLRKRYSSAGGSDDEQDDYGFNRRPSVRGIKPRFGSTTEILQQMQSQIAPPLPSGSHVSWPYYPTDERNGYRRYVEEPHYSQNVIHVQKGQSVRLPYQAGPVQVHLMGSQQSRQVVVRGTQTISTYYHIPRAGPEQFPRGPLVYYPSSPVCGSPTKMKLERGVPEGASASPHQEQSLANVGGALMPPPPPMSNPGPLPQGPLPPGPPVPAHAQTLPLGEPPMMYAMNV